MLCMPVYRYAYIGMIANAYAKEQKMSNVNYSVYEVVLSSIFTVSLGLYLWQKSDITLVLMGGVALVWCVVRISESYTVFRMFNKHPVVFAILSLFPGVVLLKAREALIILSNT